VANGVVYVGSWDYNKVYAFDAANGTLLWSVNTGIEPLFSSAIANNTLFVGCNDGTIYAYDTTTGATKWTASVGSSVTGSPAVANGVLYLGALNNRMYALNAATGETLWSGIGGNSSSPAVVNGMVYVGSSDKHLIAYALDGGRNAVYHRKVARPSYSSLHPDVRLNESAH
jgi:outer membrane protein assembly factor BamB